jgi:hypothetical protein
MQNMRRYDKNGSEVTGLNGLWSEDDIIVNGNIKEFSELNDWIEANYDLIEGGSDRDKVRIGYLLAVEDIFGKHVPTGKPCRQCGEDWESERMIDRLFGG